MIYMASVDEALQLLRVSKLFTYFRKNNSYNKIFTFFSFPLTFNGVVFGTLEASLWCCSGDVVLNPRPPYTHNEDPEDETHPPRSLLPSLLK